MSIASDPWWQGFPIAQYPNDTDVCYTCGHVRWKHGNTKLSLVRCHVEFCSCVGVHPWLAVGR